MTTPAPNALSTCSTARWKLRGTGYELVVHPCNSQDPDCADGVRRFVQQQKLHGVILGPRASESMALAQMLDAIDCRHIRINAHASEEDVQAVVTHDRDGAAAAAGYLLARPPRHRGDCRSR